MNTNRARESLPQAYALSLWLRDLGCNEEQIGAVLGIEPDGVPALLRLARLKVERELTAMRFDRERARGVLVFADDAEFVLSEAVRIARPHGALIHLVALHRTVRRSSFGASERKMRKGGEWRREAEASLLNVARRAVLLGVDVVPHVLAETPEAAIGEIARVWGPVTVVASVHREDRRHLARGARRVRSEVLAVDESGQVELTSASGIRNLRKRLGAPRRGPAGYGAGSSLM